MSDNTNEINNIQAQADIVDVIASYIPLTQKGKNFFGVCPFHDDHSPSMSVSKEKQVYKCFSCGAGGNVFTFVENYENVSFIEAVKIVAQKSGLSFNSHIRVKQDKDSKLYEIMDIACKFYQNNLNTSEAKEAKEYLASRNIGDSIIKDFNLGLALKQRDTLNNLLQKKDYNIKDINEVGLINVDGANIYDSFNNRIMFPIHNLEGKVVGFSGRLYDNSNLPKYFNTRETKIFKKGNILFNYHRAKDTIKLKKEIILVEGHMDAIRMYANGIKNVVALMGTAMTKDHIDIIKKLRVKVTLMFDNDEAGLIATYNNGLMLEQAGVSTNVLRISGAKDADEYILKYGVEALINNLNNPISFIEFKLNYLKQNKNLDDLNDLVSYVKQVLESLKGNQDELSKEITLKKISNDYNVDIDTLKNALNEQKDEQKIVTNPKKSDKVQELNSEAEQEILYFMMNDSKYIDIYLADLGFFDKKVHRDIANMIVYYNETYGTINLANFITYVKTNSSLGNEVEEIVKNSTVRELNKTLFEEFIKSVKMRNIKDDITKLKNDLKTETDINKKIDIVKKLTELKKGSVKNG
ncbi:MAG: DNA primase [Bacilli bacterium]|nr:DNA primase [Bacilli bacterium]